MTTLSRDGEAYRLHLYVYGKVIQGRDHRGKIMPGADHRNTGRSLGFPDALQAYCAPDQFVAQWQGANSVDGRTMPGGAMLYRPVHVGGRLYGLFARVQSRSEAGANTPGGRAYTHCAVLAVEDRWEPELIPAMAALLFDETRECLGVPNFDGQKNRLELPIDELHRDYVHDLAQSHEDAAAHPAILLAQDLASQLSQADLNVHGRWLPFALGVKQGVEARSGRFHALHHGGDTVSFSPPWFSDSNPPEAAAQPDMEGEIDSSRFPAAARARQARVIFERRPMLRPGNLWQDQMDALPAQAAEAGRRDATVQNIRNTVDSSLQQPRSFFEAFLSEEQAEISVLQGDALASAMSAPVDELAQYLKLLHFSNPDHRAYVESVDLGYIRAARDYLHGRLSGLSRPHFDVYRFAEEDRKVVRALEAVLGLSLRIAVQGDLSKFGSLIATDLLYMPALPRLGLPTEGQGSAFAYLAYALHHYLNEQKVTHASDVSPLVDWFTTYGYPSVGMTADGERKAKDASSGFAKFAQTFMMTPRHECYTEKPLGKSCFTPWWGWLRDHAQAHTEWLPRTRWTA